MYPYTHAREFVLVELFTDSLRRICIRILFLKLQNICEGNCLCPLSVSLRLIFFFHVYDAFVLLMV